jgi:hypothetical protein
MLAPLGSCAISHTTFRFVSVLVGFVLERSHMPKIARSQESRHHEELFELEDGHRVRVSRILCVC